MTQKRNMLGRRCFRSDGDALGMTISHVLDDYFMRTWGRLAAISLVRCGLSDDGAKAMARGISASSTLTYVDLSGLTPPQKYGGTPELLADASLMAVTTVQRGHRCSHPLAMSHPERISPSGIVGMRRYMVIRLRSCMT